MVTGQQMLLHPPSPVGRGQGVEAPRAPPNGPAVPYFPPTPCPPVRALDRRVEGLQPARRWGALFGEGALFGRGVYPKRQNTTTLGRSSPKIGDWGLVRPLLQHEYRKLDTKKLFYDGDVSQATVVLRISTGM